MCPKVERVYAEAAAEYPIFFEAISQADAGLEVIQIPFCQTAFGMNDRTGQSRERVDRGGAELTLLPILGAKRRFILPPYTQVQCELGAYLPIVLEVACVAPPLGQPGCQVPCEGRSAHGAKHEAGKLIASVGTERELRAAERVSS